MVGSFSFVLNGTCLNFPSGLQQSVVTFLPEVHLIDHSRHWDLKSVDTSVVQHLSFNSKPPLHLYVCLGGRGAASCRPYCYANTQLYFSAMRVRILCFTLILA